MSERPHLVLVPGMLCDAALWAHQIEHMEDIAECHVGDTRSDDTIAGMARTILHAAPMRFALAGLSMGGIVAFEIMRQAPERVVRLALLDTSATPDSEAGRQRRLDHYHRGDRRRPRHERYRRHWRRPRHWRDRRRPRHRGHWRRRRPEHEDGTERWLRDADPR